MSKIIFAGYLSLDGVMGDPNGSEGTKQGGWLFRHGPDVIAGDPFGISAVLDTGCLLLGRRSWEFFAKIWPDRDDPFSTKMNAMPKLVVSRSLEHVDGWQNSTVLQGDLVEEARKRKQEQDVVIVGSGSVVRTLMAYDLVDEFRLIVFPMILGEGSRLFSDGTAPVDLALVSTQTIGPAVRLIYTRKHAGPN